MLKPPSNLPVHSYEEKMIHLYTLYILSKDINVYIDSHSDACIYERSMCLSLTRIFGLSCTCMDLLHAFVDCHAYACISCMHLWIVVHECVSQVAWICWSPCMHVDLLRLFVDCRAHVDLLCAFVIVLHMWISCAYLRIVMHMWISCVHLWIVVHMWISCVHLWLSCTCESLALICG